MNTETLNTIENSSEVLNISELKRMGILSDFCAGIQFDVMVALAKLNHELRKNAGLCDHNCTVEVGGYDCGMAKTKRPGQISIKSLAPAEVIIGSLKIIIAGLKDFNSEFVNDQIHKLAEIGAFPRELVVEFKKIILNQEIILNLFGGNPELHPEIFQIIRGAKERGLSVNLTTTGGMFMNDTFAKKLIHEPTDIALSADDFESAEQIKKLARLVREDKEAFKKTWLSIPALFGQKRKALEAIYAANFFHENGIQKDVLFNMVIHKGNINSLFELIEALKTEFPNVKINPFPAQEAFYRGQSGFHSSDIDLWRKIIDDMIEAHLENEPWISKKFHYWIFLKAGFELYSAKPDRFFSFLSGYESWQCYSENVGAGRFVQVGGSPELIEGDRNVTAGNHLNCFWNGETIYNPSGQAFDLTPEQVSEHIKSSMREAYLRNQDHACAGCNFPRLNALDEMVIVAGMNPEVLSKYKEIRRSYLNY